MGRLAEQQARWIFQQLIIGLDYCHSRVSNPSSSRSGPAGSSHGAQRAPCMLCNLWLQSININFIQLKSTPHPCRA